MANILITNDCNLKCEYCFAENELERGKNKHNQISMEDFDKRIEYLKRSHSRRIGIIGGEPTLHTELFQLIDRSLESGLDVLIFTNGTMSPERSKKLAEYKGRNVSFLLNLNDKGFYTAGQLKNIEAFMENCGQMIGVGYTIYTTDFDLTFHRDMILKYNLSRQMRLGLASPIPGLNQKDFFSYDEYKDVGTSIIKNIIMLEKDNILIGFDCGFVMCMFTEEQHGILTTRSGGFKSNCSPIIDIDMKGEVYHCFPLSQILRQKLTDTTTQQGLGQFYDSKLKFLKKFGKNSECFSCVYLERNQCAGMCYGKILNSEPQLMEQFRS